MEFSSQKGYNITRKFLREELHGKPNSEIFRIILGRKLPDNEVHALGEEKESMYRDIVNNLEGGAKLAEGVEVILNDLKSRNIPIAIATSSSKGNVEFYKQRFGLNRSFSDDFNVYDAGSYQGKPAPDIFMIASERLGLDPAECVVVEDSVTGIESAKNAGIGRIYLITTGNHLAWDNSDPNVTIIRDFM
jgi:HAD superfamily hydrolase (TIGR01509 family)